MLGGCGAAADSGLLQEGGKAGVALRGRMQRLVDDVMARDLQVRGGLMVGGWALWVVGGWCRCVAGAGGGGREMHHSARRALHGRL